MIRTSEILTSKTHIEPLRDEGYVIYKLGWITPVNSGKREAKMLWGNVKSESTGKLVTQTAHSFTFGTCIKRNGAGAWIKSKADTRANAGTVGIVSEVIDADHFRYIKGGLLPGDFVDGADYWLSTTTAGDIFIQSDPEEWEIGNVREFIGTGTPEGLEVEIDLGDEITEVDLGQSHPPVTIADDTVGKATIGSDQKLHILIDGGSETSPETITSTTGNSIDEVNSTHTHGLDATGVTPGAYSPAAITVDSKGRITEAHTATLPSGSWSAIEETTYYRNQTKGAIAVANMTRTFLFRMYAFQGATKLGEYMAIVDYRSDGGTPLVETKVIYNTLPATIEVYFDYDTAVYAKVAYHLNNNYGSTIYSRRCWQTIWQSS